MIEYDGIRSYDTKELAEFTSKSVRQIRRMISAGKVDAYKVGKSYYVREDEFKRVFLGIAPES